MLMHALRIAQVGDLRRDYPMPRHVHDDTAFLVHEGDLDALGPIDLDWPGAWETGVIVERLTGSSAFAHTLPMGSPAVKAVHGLLVTGSLRIADALVNAGSDCGATLIVLGNLCARQASCGGAFVRIGGDVHIDDVLYAHGNDGELHIGGRLFAKALINHDHGVLMAGDSKGQPPIATKVIDLRELQRGDDDDQVPGALRKLLGGPALGLSSILKALRECRPTARLDKPQTPQEWTDVIWSDLKAIRKLPKQLRTEEMYLLLLAGDCTLSEPEIHELVSKIPSAMLSERVRTAAFLLSPRSLIRLPPKFDLQQEYARCLSALGNPGRYVGEIPTHLLPVEWQRAP